METDRNLLFAVLALQADLLDQDQFVQACALWTTRKGTPIADLFVERGWLTPDDRADVERLLTRKLKKHGGDIQASLAEVTVAATVQQSLFRLGDKDLEMSLGRMPTPPSPSFDSQTRPPSMGTHTSSGLRFHILRPHARGGLGEVFVAHDSELNRQVALKEMRDTRADDVPSRQRFLLEAEITGGLEHPGVVPVYGLGTYADGRPFYAMRFIRGLSLQDAIAQYHRQQPISSAQATADDERKDAEAVGSSRSREFELRGLLTRFVAVCNAIAYAHSRGIIHRDIKPANIMLGPYGETLVVDWGLAKSMGSNQPPASSEDWAEGPLRPSTSEDVAATLEGAVLGTPSFMSPEQAAGRLDLVGPASDVYSLGATLYCLLTGVAPFRGSDRGELLQRVQRGEFSPPRQVLHEISPGMEAICLKAMALDPRARYSSADALARDIERWLADEPVTAHREPLSLRLKRWSRRHRTLVTGATAALVVAALSLGASTVVLTAAHGRERSARELAQQREKEANDNFQLARDAVDRYCTHIGDDPRLKERDLRPLRKQLFQTAVDFYQRFMEFHQGEPGLRAELGRAYYRLGLLSQEIDTTPRIIAYYEQALASFEGMSAEHPEEADFRHSAALCQDRLGALYGVIGRKPDARRMHDQALATMKGLAAEHPEEPKYHADLARFRQNLGNSCMNWGEKREAEAAYREALLVMEPLAQAYPENSGYQLDLARSHNNLGVLYQQDRPTEAEKEYKKGLEITEKLHRKYPKSLVYTDALAGSHNNLANLYLFVARMDEAVGHYKMSIELMEQLSTANPSVVSYRKDLANGYNNFAGLLQEMGRLTEAVPLCHKAIPVLERLCQDEPDNGEFIVSLCAAYGNLGNTLRDLGKPQQGLTWYDQALPRLEALLQREPSHELARLIYRSMRVERALALARSGSHVQAGQEGEAALRDPRPPGELLYEASRVFAAAATAADKDGKLTASDRDKLRRGYADRCFELLRAAHDAGYFLEPTRIGQFKNEPDFAGVRRHQAFGELLNRLGKPGKSRGQ